MGERRRSWWGWGWEGEGLARPELEAVGRKLAARLGTTELAVREPPALADLKLPPPRLTPPATLAAVCSSEVYDRAAHTYGKSFRDVVRAFRSELPSPPDIVAHPRTEDEVVALLDWCGDAGAAVVPYGGGSSVVGGVDGGGIWAEAYAGVVTIDLSRLDRVLEVDRASRAARIQAGALGPVLEAQLKPQGLTLRHFPQSFEFSTLGGWIATRSGGHYATLYTHIDEFVESLRMVTPRGVLETRRLPGSGAGPSPDRLLMGSEGSLGIITEAWMRLQDRPRFRAQAAVRFSSFEAGVAASRALAQSGLYPTNCRLLDATEAEVAGVGGGNVLIVAFESADHPTDAWMARAVELCRDHGGEVPEEVAPSRTDERASREGAAGTWRDAFLRGPYLRDAMVALGVLSETFESAVTWDRFEAFHAGVMQATREAMREVGAGAGWISCRFTHVYPDGPAPYYTVLGPGRPGGELEQWAAIKKAAAEAILRLGGTITHHHSVGRDHQPWYARQRTPLFGEVLRAAKAALDPAGILNPGVVV
jgi:alkyldihydroxyacetonephosphate synthase